MLGRKFTISYSSVVLFSVGLLQYGAVHGYLNIIEDVRIEKFMKNKYPGLRKSFIQGYKQLNDRDFFEIKDRDLSTMLLIDRINIYFKCGINSGVKFTAEEMEFVRRVDRCDTIADVQALAAEVYEYTKGELKKKKEEAKNNKNLTAEDLEDIEDEMIAAFDDEDILAAIDDQLDYEYDPYSDDEEVGDTKELTPEEKEAAKKFSAVGRQWQSHQRILHALGKRQVLVCLLAQVHLILSGRFVHIDPDGSPHAGQDMDRRGFDGWLYRRREQHLL